MNTLNPLVILLKKVVRILSKSGRHDHTLPLFKNLNILPLKCLYVYNVPLYIIYIYIYKISRCILKEYKAKLFVSCTQLQNKISRKYNNYSRSKDSE